MPISYTIKLGLSSINFNFCENIVKIIPLSEMSLKKSRVSLSQNKQTPTPTKNYPSSVKSFFISPVVVNIVNVHRISQTDIVLHLCVSFPFSTGLNTSPTFIIVSLIW